MALKCPACGFESAEGAQWCDFCKEPFAKKRPQAASPAAPAPAAPAPVPISLEGLPPEAVEKLSAGLTPDQEEKLPLAPRWLRPLALAFVGIVLFSTALLSLLVVMKMRHAPR